MDCQDALGLSIENGVLVLEDLRYGKKWTSLSPIAALRTGGDDWNLGHLVRGCRTTSKETEKGITGELAWERPEAVTRIPFSIELSDSQVLLNVDPASGLVPADRLELEFPRGLGRTCAGEDGYLLLPIGMGTICDFSTRRKPRTLVKNIYSGGQTGITMPLFGTVHGTQTLGCIVDTPFDCKIKTEMNVGKRKIYAQTPVWVIDERTNSTRKAHYFPLEKGGYVEIAKQYRKEAISSGRFITLREKARDHPEVDQTTGSLLGHRYLTYVEPPGADTYDTKNTYGFFRAALRAGFDRVIAHNVLRGEPSEMAEAARFARSLSPGFRLSVYENYVDIFRTGEKPEKKGDKKFPDWDESLIARQRDGSIRPNWRVKRKGQPDIWTYTVCSARRLQVALPQMEELSRVFGQGSIYIDVEGAVPLFDCYDETHPVTKEEDSKCRIELLREVKRRFGVVSTEALPQDFLCPVVEVGSYFSVFPHSGYGNSESRIMPPLVPVPLHPLVWHGSVLNQTGTGTNFYQSDPPHAALFGWLADTMDDKGRRIAYKLRGTGYSELLSHRFVTGPRVVIGPDDAFHCDDVQITRFSDGTTVVGNFASLPYRWRGRTIPPMDFLILNERLSLKVELPKRATRGSEIEIRITSENTWDREIYRAGLTLLGRGAAHSEPPVFESELPALEPGQKSVIRASLKAPDEVGQMWVVATIRVRAEDPWEVTEIVQCEVV